MKIPGYNVQYGLHGRDIARFVQYANRGKRKGNDEVITKRMIETLIKRSDYYPKAHIILWRNNQVIGDTMVQVDANRFDDKLSESQIAIHIDPKHFNEALFKRLLQESLGFAKKHGNKAVSIFNLGDRTKLKLLKEAGFKEIQREYLLRAELSSKPSVVKLRPGYVIRGFRKEDIDTYIELVGKVATERGAAKPPPSVLKTLFETAISPSDVFVAEHDGKMIGVGMGFPETTQDRKGGEMKQLWVITEERGKGVERALRNTVLNHLFVHGMKYVTTTCFSVRRSSRFYREVGFRTTGIRITLRKEL